MAELYGIDLGTHLEAIVREFRATEKIYGYPRKKFYLGFPGFDLSVDFHDKKASTPLGPASGPHTQMVQNIILSFLGGGRIMELKTIQILDQLEIPRPCIDIRNIGFNVEWSQELRLEDSYTEYVGAWVLLKIIEEMEILGIPKGDPFYNTIFDISVGYGLKGISSPQVNKWIGNMRDAGEAIEKALDTLGPKFNKYKKMSIDPEISNTTTLSTFHGCPGEEIESIMEHLISEHHLHAIVKMNPTILGYDFVEKTLHDDLGYINIELDQQAFENDLQFDEGVAMMKRLEKFARKYDRKVGAKFTNTLVIKNSQEIFKDEVMYLSGSPLHVLSMNAMHRFRREMGDHFHISFSAGITKHNFADAVSCNMKPISTCSDLLKTGGYMRMADYLKNLKDAMENLHCGTVSEFIARSAGKDDVDVNTAGMINADNIVSVLSDQPRYQQKMNFKEPPKIDSHLKLFDCITCNKCLPVCPNAANFSIPTGEIDITKIDYRYIDGKFLPTEGERFVLTKKNQIANLADFCNECGDCDTYCPEYGGPFIEKPRFFSSRMTYDKYHDYDGFYFPSPFALKGRVDGIEYYLSIDPETSESLWRTDEIEFTLDGKDRLQTGKSLGRLADRTTVKMDAFYIMKTLLSGILNNTDDYTSIILRGDHAVN